MNIEVTQQEGRWRLGADRGQELSELSQESGGGLGGAVDEDKLQLRGARE